MSRPTPPNLLAESGLPIVYPVDVRRVLSPPDPEGHDVALRTAVRSLTVMQKEAIVTSTSDGSGWRLASDEGPYLQGHDSAPAPLAHLVTGLAADLLAAVEAHLAKSGLAPEALRIGLDSRFTMEGSLPRGTMVGGALPPEVTVFIGATDRPAAAAAVLSGVMASVTAGITHAQLTSVFSLTSHGRQIPVRRVAPLDDPPPLPDERPPRFPVPLSAPLFDLVVKTWGVGDHTADAGSSLQPEQRRTLHLHAEAARRPDGLATVEVAVRRPHGSTFRFLVDEPADRRGGVRAPDALTYVSAGIGFCFMTQIGRYAKILQRSLGDYHIVQDTRFSYGKAEADPKVGGRAAAPRTHVYLAPDDESFAAEALDMSEQTCFIHAMCRSALRPRVRVVAAR